MSTTTDGTNQIGDGVCAVTTLAGVRVSISVHAVERYQQRVKPHLSCEQAAKELCLMLPVAGERLVEPPPWIRGPERNRCSYIALGPDIVLAAGSRSDGFALVTCLTTHMRMM